MGSRSKSQTGMDKEGKTEITITNVPVYDPWGHLTEVKYGQFGQMINGSLQTKHNVYSIKASIFTIQIQKRLYYLFILINTNGFDYKMLG